MCSSYWTLEMDFVGQNVIMCVLLPFGVLSSTYVTHQGTKETCKVISHEVQTWQ